MRLIESGLSVVAALRASAVLGRASRKQRVGRLSEALAIAKGGLSILQRPYVRRNNPPEGSVQAGLTVLAESLAWQLNVPGVSLQDLTDALAVLRKCNTGNPPPELCEYIPFLEARLAAQHKTTF
jgi:hypothetical protein